MNRKNYNGLHLPNGLHVPPGQNPQFGAGSQEEQMKRAIAMEMQSLTREIYVRAAARLLSGNFHEGTFSDDNAPEPREMEELARTSREFSKAFFTGLGVIAEETEPVAE